MKKNDYKLDEPYFWNQFHNSDMYEEAAPAPLPKHFGHGGTVKGIPLDLKNMHRKKPVSIPASAADAVALAKRLGVTR
jgi:hypothetical protein